jgi:hypothetical protein
MISQAVATSICVQNTVFGSIPVFASWAKHRGGTRPDEALPSTTEHQGPTIAKRSLWGLNYLVHVRAPTSVLPVLLSKRCRPHELQTNFTVICSAVTAPVPEAASAGMVQNVHVHLEASRSLSREVKYLQAEAVNEIWVLREQRGKSPRRNGRLWRRGSEEQTCTTKKIQSGDSSSHRDTFDSF